MAVEAHIDASVISKAERGHVGISSFCNNIGAYAETLNLSTEDVTFLMNALWADVLFAAIAAAKPDPGGRGTSRLRLLQTIWHHPDARRWFNVLVFDSPPPQSSMSAESTSRSDGEGWSRIPCLQRHRDVQRRFPTGGATSTIERSDARPGRKLEEPSSVLQESLFVGHETTTSPNPLQILVRDATPDALAALQQGNGSKPVIGDLLRVLVAVAKRDSDDRVMLLRRLRSLPAERLHPVDWRYRARGIYDLGDHQALCPFAIDDVPETVIEYYVARNPGQAADAEALASLARRVAWALAERSAPLACFYLKVIVALIASSTSERAGSVVPVPLANYYASNALFDVAKDIYTRGAGAWDAHDCARGQSPCADVAIALSRDVLVSVNRVAKALGIQRFSLES